jgi:outer membrane immunogenic protein
MRGVSIMKQSLFAATAALVFAGSSAVAADLPIRAPAYKAPPSAYFSWTGCYIGAYAGGAWGGGVDTHDPRSTGGAFAAGTFYNAPTANAGNGGTFGFDQDSSVIAGGTLGCNWQAPASAFVLGIEAEGGYIRLRGDTIDPFSTPLYGSDTVVSAKVGDWYAVVAGRLGFAIDRTLFYAKAGVGFSETKASIIDACSTGSCGSALLTATGSGDRAFWVAGGGIEYAFTPNWSIKAEYLFLSLDHSFSVCGPGAGSAAGSTFCANVDIDGVHTAKIGINYRFSGSRY